MVLPCSVRGSARGDRGAWLQEAPLQATRVWECVPSPPVAWDPHARLLWRADGRVFRLDRRPCKALKLHECSAAALAALPLRPAAPAAATTKEAGLPLKACTALPV